MSIRSDIEELEKINNELQKQLRQRSLHQILKLLIIGIFTSRSINRKLLEIKTRRELVVRRIEKYFRQLNDLLSQLSSIDKAGIPASSIHRMVQIESLLTAEKDLTFLVAEKTMEELAFVEKEIFWNCRQMILESVKQFSECRKSALENEVKEIRKSGTYLVHDEKERLLAGIALFEEHLEQFKSNKILCEFRSTIQRELGGYREAVLSYNKEFIEERKRTYHRLFNNNAISLDEEQKDAIVTDDKYNLVIASAGSGKTEALITRIAYLVNRKPDSIQPNCILAIAYQNKDVNQIEQRLHERYGIDQVEVKTFHKLGMKILQKAGREISPTDIVNENKKHEIIRNLDKHRLATEPDYSCLFLQYLKTLHDDEKNGTFRDKAENLQYVQNRAYRSIDKTRVNSKAEKEIMNFFLMNKLNGETIAVAYEPDLSGFRPDFCLPKYDLFIEHWALDKNGEVPWWFSQTTEEYKEKMKMKKDWFSKNNKLFVETFAHEYNELNPETFTELLKRRIIEKLEAKHASKFEFSPLSYDELVEIAWGRYKDPTDYIVNFITNAKTYGVSPERIAEKLRSGKWSNKQLAFGNMAVRIYADYRDFLTRNRKTDFEDMINEAVKELNNDSKLYANVYDHILIDEYQDISRQRYRLIKELLDRNPKCKLFCVGDDWQSIMGFSGSNLDFFVNFGKYFANPATTKISTNYRSVKTIVDAGAQLIKNNGSCQIPKRTISSLAEEKPIKVLRSPHKESYRARYYEQTTEDCLTRINKYLQDGVAPQDILVLIRFMRTRIGRGYRFQHIIKILREKAQEMNIGLACDNVYDPNRIRVLTAHKSKGLEAKVVFLLNVIKDAYGFPSEIEDDSIYAPTRENYPEQDPKEEERRLFYVAMTRAKKDLIIYTWEPSKSEFLEEIKAYTQEERLGY